MTSESYVVHGQCQWQAITVVKGVHLKCNGFCCQSLMHPLRPAASFSVELPIGRRQSSRNWAKSESLADIIANFPHISLLYSGMGFITCRL